MFTRKRKPYNYTIKTMLAVLLLSAGALSASAKTPLGEKWEPIIEPLSTMPVQDTGFIRGALTFTQSRLLAISDKRAFEGTNSLLTLLPLIVDPGSATTETAPALIKLEHPALVKAYGGKARVNLKTFRTTALYNKMIASYHEEDRKIKEEFEKYGKQRKNILIAPINKLEDRATALEGLASDFAIIPRVDGWLSPSQLVGKIRSNANTLLKSDMLILKEWDALTKAIAADDAAAGLIAATALRANVLAAAADLEVPLPHLGLDVFYEKFQPFSKSAFFFVFAALCYGASMLFRKPKRSLAPLAWVGYGFLAGGFGLEMLGVVCRWILAGRAPLSNMYESFTFATAGLVLVALIFEAVQRNRLAGFGAALLGFIFMVLAHKMPIFDSKIKPLMPALDSAWLTYHVVTIMLSYSAFALSFFVALVYLLKKALGGDDSRIPLARRMPTLASLDVYNYKVIAVGFPLLTIGIILGAVWAATAWGRPWGFDPKETWSLVTWIVYAGYLHVRLLAGWRGLGAAVVSVVGFLCVLFTYFGVNFWLPGLHSYV